MRRCRRRLLRVSAPPRQSCSPFLSSLLSSAYQVSRQKKQSAPREEAERKRPPFFCLKFGNEVGCADIKCNTSGERQSIRAKRRKVLSRKTAQHRRDCESYTCPKR